MSEISRKFFVDSISATSVQLRRVPGQSSRGGQPIHQVNLITGNDTAINAQTGRIAFFKTGCIQYEVIIRKVS